jgi:hypothetical protein
MEPEQDPFRAAEWQAWQARWFEAIEAASEGDPFTLEAFEAQRRAGRTLVQRACQEYDLAQAINSGDIAGYIQHWHPPETPNGPAPASVIPVTWRAVADEDDKFGIISDAELEVPKRFARGGIVYGGSQVVTNQADDPFDGTLLAGTLGSARDPATVGDQDNKLGSTRQPRQARTHSVSAWALRHCLLALGRWLSLFDPPGRDR